MLVSFRRQPCVDAVMLPFGTAPSSGVNAAILNAPSSRFGSIERAENGSRAPFGRSQRDEVDAFGFLPRTVQWIGEGYLVVFRRWLGAGCQQDGNSTRACSGPSADALKWSNLLPAWSPHGESGFGRFGSGYERRLAPFEWDAPRCIEARRVSVEST